ncbi:MAG: hypothetical protein ACXVW2_16700 [Nocardioidaceae bacterium]
MTQTIPTPTGRAGAVNGSPRGTLRPVVPQQRATTAEVPAGPPPVERRPVDVLFDPTGVTTASMRQVSAPSRGTGYLPFRFNIGDVLTVGSDIPLPELEFFREPRLGRGLDIEVRVGKVGTARPRSRARLVRFDAPAGLRYEEHFGRLGANFSIDLGERITVTVSSLLARSPHVAYTNIIEALLRYAVAARGAMLLHSACVEIDGRGLMLSARTDTGKTGTVLRLLREHGARFLSDDMTILHPDGTAQCFPKPLTISSHTLRAVDPGDLSHREWMVLGVKSRLHSKGGRGIGMRIGEANLPVMTANALTQMLIPPPKYGADRLVACEVIPRTTVSDLFVIERGSPALTSLSPAAALQELMANTDDAYGFPPYRYVAPVLLVGGEEYAALRAREEQVLRSALGRMRTRRLASDSFGWATEIPRLIAEDGE